MGAKPKVTKEIFDQVHGLRRQGRTYNFIAEVTQLSTQTIYRVANSKSFTIYVRDLQALNRLNYEKYTKKRLNNRAVPAGQSAVPTIPLIEDIDLEPPKPRKSRPFPTKPRIPAYATKRKSAQEAPKPHSRVTIADVNASLKLLTRQVNKLSFAPIAPVEQPQRRGILARLFQ